MFFGRPWTLQLDRGTQQVAHHAGSLSNPLSEVLTVAGNWSERSRLKKKKKSGYHVHGHFLANQHLRTSKSEMQSAALIAYRRSIKRTNAEDPQHRQNTMIKVSAITTVLQNFRRSHCQTASFPITGPPSTDPPHSAMPIWVLIGSHHRPRRRFLSQSRRRLHPRARGPVVSA